MELDFLARYGVYECLVYVAWCDGHLAAHEISGARVVAEELDLVEGSLTPGALLLRGPPVLADLGLERADLATRALAYATATWTAQLDGEVHAAERAVLRMLRYRLRISESLAGLLHASVALARVHAEAAPMRTEYRALTHAVSDVLFLEEPSAPSAVA